jgi:hypothetical protein
MNSISTSSYRKEDGTPDLAKLINAFKRCAPSIPGGIYWLDNQRFCRWPHQHPSGKKFPHHTDPNSEPGHNSVDPNNEAKPWNGASDMRPFVVDDIINERVAMKTASFWRAMMQSQTGGESEEESYAIALAEWLIFTKLTAKLNKEVELSAQYAEHYGWCLIGTRWKTEISLKRYTLTLAQIQQEAVVAQKQLQAEVQSAGVPPAAGNGAPQQQSPTLDPEALKNLQDVAQLPSMITDPSREAEAIQYLQDWYDGYIKKNLPESVQNQAPKMAASRVRKCVRDLRLTGTCTAPLPYVVRDEPEMFSLKPWEEVFIPPELTTANEMIFLAEWVSETELDNRLLAEDYDPTWVEAAKKQRGQFSLSTMMIQQSPAGLPGLLGGGVTQTPVQTPVPGMGLIQIVHAVYRDVDEDGVPGVYMTTFHPLVGQDRMRGDLFGKDGLADGALDGDLPYEPCCRENWARAITSSRSVAEMASTQQNIIKGILDGLIDRQSITLLPPVNVYESPTGTKYSFGPAKQNYVRQGKEPEFMELPSGQGTADAVETHGMIRKGLDNRFALMSEDVPQPRMQTQQEKDVRSFLIAWTNTLRRAIALCQMNMDDEEFAEITGAPVGWLESRRQEAGLLTLALEFDVRELDSELALKKVEAMNKLALPNDTMGVIQRGRYSEWMTRLIAGPRASKFLIQPMPDATQQLQDKAKMEVLQMFAGNPPRFVDKDDPTAASLLQFTQQIVTGNPTYLRNLTDEALQAVAGQNANAVAQQIGQRTPDPRFSMLLLKWLENLKFIGVTQVQNRQTGAIGVNPNADQGPGN